MLKIIADAQIPQVTRAFAGLGDVQLYSGRDITASVLGDSDALLVRTVTCVDETLLQNSRVQFVATATSGTDHVDIDYLQHRGITFASAHGCNARAVAEYVLSALFVLADQRDFDLFSRRVGIIGCGKVGSCLQEMLQVLDIDFVLHDPPLAEATGDTRYRSLQEVLDADIISLHVPLTDSGSHPTRDLVNAPVLSGMKPGTILLNTSRGGVVNEIALLDAIHDDIVPVIDVWRGEPEIDLRLLAAVAIGTPHIAGYSMDGRLRATAMIRDKFCEYFSVANDWTYTGDWQALDRQQLIFHESLSDRDIIAMSVLSHYDVRSDAAALRRLPEIDSGSHGEFFDQLRRNYPVRREFAATAVHLQPVRSHLVKTLRELGFEVMERNT